MKKDKSNSGVVYWAHLPEHTDNKTQGYVGFATFFPQRKAKHYYNAATKADSNTHFYNALNKYSTIIWDILFEGPIEECVALEYQLRPDSNIGWNIIPGGCTQTGKNHPRYGKKTPETAKAIMREKAIAREGTPVKCITTGEEFICIKDASTKYNLQSSNIRKACKGIISYTGIHPETGKKLKWEYIIKDTNVTN